ncbi:MAG: RNA polymerase sigma factor, partial [Solirubrobacteraceae bacterium]
MADRKSLVTAPSALRRRIAGDERLVAFVRAGEKAAFEALYERHAAELLSFCVYMLGSRQDAEDAVQATFSSAYTSLLRDNRPIMVRPWLFAIARNDCLSILRRRRPWEELNGEPALGPDPARELELREELNDIVIGVRRLPEHERAALVLTELHGLSQRETGTVLGVRTEQVKAYVYQARSKLISEREARETDCREIREELASARGAALLRGRLRRHMRSCEDCRSYAAGVSRQRRQLAALLPIAPSLALRYRVLEQVLGLSATDPGYTGSAAVGASLAGAAAEVAGGGVKALGVKIAAGIAAVSAGAGVGVSVLSPPLPTEPPARAAVPVTQRLPARSPAPGGRARLLAVARVDAGAGEGVTRSAPGTATPDGHAPTSFPGDAGGRPVGGGGTAEATLQGAQHTSTGTPRSVHGRSVAPTPPKTEEQRKALEAERNQSRETRLHTSRERKHEREVHGPPGSAKAPRTEAQREREQAERKKAREENPRGHSRAPRSEEERRV